MQINCIHYLFLWTKSNISGFNCGVTVKTLKIVKKKNILFKKGEILNKTPD